MQLQLLGNDQDESDGEFSKIKNSALFDGVTLFFGGGAQIGLHLKHMKFLG